MTHCPACGSEITAESRFFDSCGNSLSASEEPTRTSSPSALPTGLASSTIFTLGLVAALGLHGFKIALPQRTNVSGVNVKSL